MLLHWYDYCDSPPEVVTRTRCFPRELFSVHIEKSIELHISSRLSDFASFQPKKKTVKNVFESNKKSSFQPKKKR